jgi:hypothetical protein
VLQVLKGIGMDEATLLIFRDADLSRPQAIMFDEPPYKAEFLPKSIW